MTTTSSTTPGISTPSPIRMGMVLDCNEFYLVKSGDSCDAIVEEYDITLDEFYHWNPAVGITSRYYLIVADYMCVSVESMQDRQDSSEHALVTSIQILFVCCVMTKD